MNWIIAYTLGVVVVVVVVVVVGIDLVVHVNGWVGGWGGVKDGASATALDGGGRVGRGWRSVVVVVVVVVEKRVVGQQGETEAA